MLSRTENIASIPLSRSRLLAWLPDNPNPWLCRFAIFGKAKIIHIFNFLFHLMGLLYWLMLYFPFSCWRRLILVQFIVAIHDGVCVLQRRGRREASCWWYCPSWRWISSYLRRRTEDYYMWSARVACKHTHNAVAGMRAWARLIVVHFTRSWS